MVQSSKVDLRKSFLVVENLLMTPLMEFELHIGMYFWGSERKDYRKVCPWTNYFMGILVAIKELSAKITRESGMTQLEKNQSGAGNSYKKSRHIATPESERCRARKGHYI